MGLFTKVVVKIVANIAALWIATTYVAGFTLIGGLSALVIGGVILAAINLIIRPILKFISLPLLVLTLGTFYIIIFIIVLMIADALIPQLSVSGFPALLWGALIIGVINTIVH